MSIIDRKILVTKERPQLNPHDTTEGAAACSHYCSGGDAYSGVIDGFDSGVSAGIAWAAGQVKKFLENPPGEKVLLKDWHCSSCGMDTYYYAVDAAQSGFRVGIMTAVRFLMNLDSDKAPMRVFQSSLDILQGTDRFGEELKRLMEGRTNGEVLTIGKAELPVMVYPTENTIVIQSKDGEVVIEVIEEGGVRVTPIGDTKLSFAVIPGMPESIARMLAIVGVSSPESQQALHTFIWGLMHPEEDEI